MADRNDQAYNAPNLPDNKLIEAQLDPPWGNPSAAQDQVPLHTVDDGVILDRAQRQAKAPSTPLEQPRPHQESSTASRHPPPAFRSYDEIETAIHAITIIRRDTGYTGPIGAEEAINYVRGRYSPLEFDTAVNLINSPRNDDPLAPIRNGQVANQPQSDHAEETWRPGEPLAVETLLYLEPLGCATPLSTMNFTEQKLWLELVTGTGRWDGHRLARLNFADAAAIRLQENGRIEVLNREGERNAFLLPVINETVLNSREEHVKWCKLGERYYWIGWENKVREGA